VPRCRPILHCLCALSFVMLVMVEATASYTARPAVDAVLAMDFYLGACRVDMSLISCAKEFYPLTSALTFLVICITVAIALVLRNRERF
jgi:hypothetical protein